MDSVEEFEAALAKLFEKTDDDDDTGIVHWARAMITWEREVCARIAEKYTLDGVEIAAQIRDRSR